MSRLTKSERLALQARWLEIWHEDGKPQLNQSNDMHAGGRSPYTVSHWGYAQQMYGQASRLTIDLGHHDLTELVSLLGRERLSGPDHNRVINIRSGAGRDADAHMLGRKAFLIHKEAALALRDVEALRACDTKLSIEKEAEWLAEAMTVSVASEKRGRKRL